MPDFVNALTLLNEASSALDHNELVQSDAITLYEATSAIEIGEPRMDTGVYTEEEKAFPKLDPTKALLPQEIIWIMDGMLELEVNWLQGYALAQTIFTCSYIHALDQLDLDDVFRRRTQDELLPVELTTIVLRAYLRGVLKTCDIQMEELLKGHAVDNEDFVSDKGGMSLLEDVEIDVVLEELAQAEHWVMSWIGPSLEHCGDYRADLLSRLQLRSSILCAVCLFAVEPPIYDQVIGHTEAARRSLNHIRTNGPNSHRVPGAFNPHLGKHLETLAPPRPSLPSQGMESVIDGIERLLDGLNSAVDLTEAPDWVSIEERFLAQAEAVMVYPYIRSLHQTVFYYDQRFCGGNRPLRWLGKVFLKDTAGCPMELWHIVETYSDMNSGEMAAVHGMIALLGQLAWRLLDYITYMGKNKSRQYRKLAKLLHLWDSLDSTIADATQPMQSLLRRHEIHYDISLLRQALRDMQIKIRMHIALLGFELDLYAPGELPLISWYILHLSIRVGSDSVGGTSVPNAKQSHSSHQADSREEPLSVAMAMFLAVLSKCLRPSGDSYARALFSRRLSWAQCGATDLQPDWKVYLDSCADYANSTPTELLQAANAHFNARVAEGAPTETQDAESLVHLCREHLSIIFSQARPGHIQ